MYYSVKLKKMQLTKGKKNAFLSYDLTFPIYSITKGSILNFTEINNNNLKC